MKKSQMQNSIQLEFKFHQVISLFMPENPDFNNSSTGLTFNNLNSQLDTSLYELKELFAIFAEEFIINIVINDGDISEWYRHRERLKNAMILKPKINEIDDIEILQNFNTDDKFNMTPLQRMDEIIDVIDYQTLENIYYNFLSIFSEKEFEYDEIKEDYYNVFAEELNLW